MLVLEAIFFSKIVFKRYVLGSLCFGLLQGFFPFFLLFIYLTFAVRQ